MIWSIGYYYNPVGDLSNPFLFPCSPISISNRLFVCCLSLLIGLFKKKCVTMFNELRPSEIVPKDLVLFHWLDKEAGRLTS